jgi:peptidyl-prolyl cis-trans isomerase A (cyclophilin A)
LKTESGLRYQFIQRGDMQQPETVSVHYEGSLETEKCLTLLIQEKTNRIQIGIGQVIEGWDEGIVLLKVGDKARS